MTLKTYYNRYIRNEIPNITFNNLAKFINIVLNKLDDLKLGYRKTKYAYVTNNEINIESLPAQTDGSTPVLIVFERLKNPFGYTMKLVTDYIDMFGEAGDNYYEKEGKTLKLIPPFTNLISDASNGVRVETSGDNYKISFYGSPDLSDVEIGYMLYAKWNDGVKRVYVSKIVAIGANYIIVDDFYNTYYDDPHNNFDWNFYPTYGITGIYESTKLTIDSTLPTQTLDVKPELFDMFNAMVFVEILSSSEYPNDRLLSLWINKLNNYLGKRNG